MSLQEDVLHRRDKEIEHNRKVGIFFCLLFFVMLVVAGIFGQQRDNARDVIKEQRLEIEILNLRIENSELNAKFDSLHILSWDNIDYWLEYFNVQHRDVVKKQIFLETENLSSDICLDNYNLTGMKNPNVRPTVSLGVKRGHAYYNSYIDSLRDYALWQQYFYKGGDYLHFLKDVGYANDPKYNSKLKQLNLS